MNKSKEEQKEFEKRLMENLDGNPMDPDLALHLETSHFPPIHQGWYDLLNKKEEEKEDDNETFMIGGI
jgi:hypothetical protein